MTKFAENLIVCGKINERKLFCENIYFCCAKNFIKNLAGAKKSSFRKSANKLLIKRRQLQKNLIATPPPLTEFFLCRHTFLDMFQQFLRCFPKEDYLIDILEYIRMSTDDILDVAPPVPEDEEDTEPPPHCDHPLESIAIGVLETRSFLFFYDEGDNKENIKAPKGGKVQRSNSDRAVPNKFQSQKSVPGGTKQELLKNNVNKDGPAKSKCPKIESLQASDSKAKPKFQNKLFANVKKAQDDSIVPALQLKKKVGPLAGSKPLKAALVNAKYVTWTRVTNDLAVLFFTCGDALIRRFYMIKMVETFAETLGITLSSLGVDTDKFHMSYQQFIAEFQSHLLYGFLVGVLVAMASTDVNELNEFIRNSEHPDKKPVAAPSLTIKDGSEGPNRFHRLTPARVTFLMDMMRDIASYVESKDFELGLPLTNFARYQELWSCDAGEDEDDEEEEEEEEEEE